MRVKKRVATSERMKGPDKKAEDILKLPDPDTGSSQKNWRWISGLPMLFIWTALYVGLFGTFIFSHWVWLRRLYRRRSLMDDLKDRKSRWQKALKSSQSALAATEVINAIYFLLSRVVDDGGFQQDKILQKALIW